MFDAPKIFDVTAKFTVSPHNGDSAKVIIYHFAYC